MDDVVADCSFPGCGRRTQAKGLCAGHYKQQNLCKQLTPLRRLRVTGSPPIVEYTEMACPELGTPCHIFNGCKNSHGYGSVRFNGFMIGVHVYVWQKANGAVPDGLVIDHRCRRRACCNVTHLRVVTNKVNSLENSVGVSAINAAKTACPQGHYYSGVNLIVERNGRRKCRTCKQKRERERYRENVESK